MLTDPPLRTSPDLWADQNRILPKGTAEPGPWRSSRTPWTIAISRAAVNPRVRRIWAVMGSQVSKTETVINIAGHRLDTDPAPMLYVGPTKSNIESVIEPRIAAMLNECETLRVKTKTGRKARKLAKEVSGVVFRLAWAGSPTELASQPTHTVILDEIDRMKTIKGEGNPVFISEARIATYPDGRLIGCSSPTAGSVETEKDPVSGIEHWKVSKAEDIQSPIWLLWQEGTRFEWAMACIDCGRHFVPRFNLLKWAEKATPREAAKTARLACPHCGTLHEETDKYRMNAGATFLAPGQNVVGYDPMKPGAPTHHQGSAAATVTAKSPATSKTPTYIAFGFQDCVRRGSLSGNALRRGCGRRDPAIRNACAQS